MDEIIEKAEFKSKVFEIVEKRPAYIRKGQEVYNVVDQLYGVSRAVKELDGIDCFYNDSLIPKFLDCAWERYKLKKNEEQ